VLVKSGAEGVLCAILPELGLGVALKVADGAQRAAEVAMAHVIIRLGIPGIAAGDVEDLIAPAIVNRRSETVGKIRAISDAGHVPNSETRNVLK
jgi:L-asparaginase II